MLVKYSYSKSLWISEKAYTHSTQQSAMHAVLLNNMIIISICSHHHRRCTAFLSSYQPEKRRRANEQKTEKNRNYFTSYAHRQSFLWYYTKLCLLLTLLKKPIYSWQITLYDNTSVFGGGMLVHINICISLAVFCIDFTVLFTLFMERKSRHHRRISCQNTKEVKFMFKKMSN